MVIASNKAVSSCNLSSFSNLFLLSSMECQSNEKSLPLCCCILCACALKIWYTRNMEIRQKVELRKLMLPGLQQSLNILPLSLPELREIIDIELNNNPLLEEIKPKNSASKILQKLSFYKSNLVGKDLNFLPELVVKNETLKDILLRELWMFAKNDLEVKIGEEIIGNIDENGYLRHSVEQLAIQIGVSAEQVEEILHMIQQFEPAGVAARSISECLLLQLEVSNELDPLIKEIVENHLENVAKKNYPYIAKSLKQPLEKIIPLIKKILKLDPKPARNFSSEQKQPIIPDIIINSDDDEIEAIINDEDIPTLHINKDYKSILKDKNLDLKAREFLAQQLRNALELLNAVNKRQATLRKIIDLIVQVQAEAIRHDLSYLKPLTLLEVADSLNMHESTISRAITNKYVKLPYGTVALKDFFSSRIDVQDGDSVSSNFVKRLIKERIEQEGKKHPLSDQSLRDILCKEYNLNISRRTVAKYREELKILSTTFRRER